MRKDGPRIASVGPPHRVGNGNLKFRPESSLDFRRSFARHAWHELLRRPYRPPVPSPYVSPPRSPAATKAPASPTISGFSLEDPLSPTSVVPLDDMFVPANKKGHTRFPPGDFQLA